MDIATFKHHFSMPLGGPMYAAPPYPFRGVQDLMIRYEADSNAVMELLPPHLEPADDPRDLHLVGALGSVLCVRALSRGLRHGRRDARRHALHVSADDPGG